MIFLNREELTRYFLPVDHRNDPNPDWTLDATGSTDNARMVYAAISWVDYKGGFGKTYAFQLDNGLEVRIGKVRMTPYSCMIPVMIVDPRDGYQQGMGSVFVTNAEHAVWGSISQLPDEYFKLSEC